MKAFVSARTVLAAAGTLLALGTVAQAQQLINVSGSSLLGTFIRGQASTNDYIGVREATPAAGRDLLSAVGSPALPAAWALNYRVSGSINGFDELINFGAPGFITSADDRTAGNTTPLNSLLLTDEWYNRAQYITSGVTSGLYTAANPGGQPQRAATAGGNRAISGTAGGVTIDVAYIDVPAVWGIRAGLASDASPLRNPNTSGYGQNPRLSVGIDGSATGSASGGGLSNALSGLGARNLADFPGRNASTDPYNANTIFEYPLTLAPIAPVTNPGTGIKRLAVSEMRWLWSTGRARTGENFVVATRDIGSGTRNAFNNYINLDPSFGIGDNVGVQSTASSQDQLGPTFWPTNKGATSGMLRTLRYSRLAVGYAGAETAVSGSSPSSWLSSSVLDIIDTFNDVYYTPAELATLFPGGPAITDYKRPTLANILDNTRTGWVINGQAQITTIGDPRAEANTFRTASLPNDGGLASGNPAMANKSAARYANNILRSIADFSATTPASQLVATPAEFLASNFTLIGAANNVIDPVTLDPQSRVANPSFSTFAQTFAQAPSNSVFQNAAYGTANTNAFPGLSPRRFALTSGSYSDGRGGAGLTSYITQGTTGTNGNTLAYESATDSGGRSVMGRNKIAFDFNGDGVRTVADAPDMIAAWRQRSGGPVWIAPTGSAGAGQDAVIEVLGDANGDGSFTAEDVRYWADGLAVNASGNLDRKAGFIAVDNAFGGSFFGTITKATGAAYVNGDARADVTGSGKVSPGWAPTGHDNLINSADLDYIYAQFTQAGITGGSADWSDINDAAITDLSADLNGDLSVNQLDVTEFYSIIGTCRADVNLSGSVSVQDIFDFLSFYFSSSPRADVNGSGSVSVQDIFDFLALYFAGC